MKTEDKIEHIFKYTDIYGANRILETNTILLKTPNQFNDPNDCDFSFTNEDSRKAFELAQEYYCLLTLKDIIEKEGPRIKKSQQPIIDCVNGVFKAQKSIISKTHVFDSNPVFWKMIKTKINKIDEYKEKMESAYEQYVTKTKEVLLEAKKSVYIGCFSKKPDSTLMWAHYADNFKGVCIEWEILRSSNSDFIFDVICSKKKPHIDLLKYIKIYLGYEFTGDKFDANNQEIRENLKKLIITKGTDWVYEKEIRFVTEKGKINPGTVDKLGNGRALYHMMTFPRRVYLGEKISKEDEQDIRKICEKYPYCEVVKTRHSYDKFDIEIDCETKPVMPIKNDKRKELYDLLNRMMSIIVESTMNIADVVFTEYINHKEHKNQKQIYNLFAEAYLSVSAFCKLMFDFSWSQAAAILRTAIEQVSALYVLSKYSDSRIAYINLFNEHGKYLSLNVEEKNSYIKNNLIPKNRINDYFDYSWIKEFTADKTYGRDQLLKLAHLDEFLVDIKETLNAFAHGSISIFQFNNPEEKWGLMSRYGRRLILTACKLYDFLCCSFEKYIGDRFFDLRLNQQFIDFRIIYLSIINYLKRSEIHDSKEN